MKFAPAQARRFASAPDRDTRAALVWGPNRALARDLSEAIARAKVADPNDSYAVTRLGDDELKKDKAKLADALVAQSLLGGVSVVWVRADGEAGAEALLQALADIGAGANVAFLLVEAGDLGSKSKIVAAFDKSPRAASIACYEESDAERAAFLKSALDAARLSMSPDARDLFVANAPLDRALARGEIEKLALFGHDLGRPIDIADLEALSALEAEGALDAASIAALSGKAGAALDALDGLDGVNGVSMLKAMERRLLRLLEARRLVDGGVNPSEVGDRLKPKVFWKERDVFAGHVRRWRLPALLDALDALATAEKRAKTGGAPHIAIAADLYRRVAARANA